MTREQKSGLIEDLTKSFESSNAIAICDYKGLSVSKIELLRKELKKSDAKAKVVKNTLAKIALKAANKDLEELKGTNIFIWGKDQLTLSKAITKFAADNKDFFIIKMGYFEGEVVNSAHIEALSKMPSKEELIGMLLSVWTAPLRYMVTGLDNLAKQKSNN
ncbi:MAG: 50S ribosomal protein L10 [Helicobacteraceae bacterium]